MLKLEDLLSSSGKYPERAKSEELTDDLKKNGEILLERVNTLLLSLGITTVAVSSGFRPSSVNSKITNAAKKSLHMLCKAVDIEDSEGKIAQAIKAKPELLKDHSLWMEDPDSTKGWVHLDISDTRKDRKVRIFKP